MRPAFAALGALLLALPGCTNTWPPAGRGGLAELRPASRTTADPADGGNAELAATLERAERLRKEGAEQRFPGRLVQIDRQIARIQRAFAGGLVEDATADLHRLDAELDELAALLRPSVVAATP